MTPRSDAAQRWVDNLARRIETPDAAVARIEPGQRVFVGTAAGEPQALTRALALDWPRLPDLEVVSLLGIGEASFGDPQVGGHLRLNTLSLGENARQALLDGRADYTPTFLSEIPSLFRSGRLPLDVALVQVSPPDERGTCSLGVSVDVVKSAVESAALVIAQVNANMPRTAGDTAVHVHDLDVVVPVDEALPEITAPSIEPPVDRIAALVAGLIEDGATVAFGFGPFAHAVPPHLQDRSDLGVHTAVLTDAVMDLICGGSATGARKTLDRGKAVASTCVGTRRLYDFVADNERLALYPSDYVNHPAVIARQRGIVAIHGALEVDLTGQACGASIHARSLSGVGGQADCLRGAALAPGGKAIVALPSTAGDGSTSRIVPHVRPGTGVLATRGDVDYVVTEHGVAYLHGKSIHERALALISIAHPDWRASLLHEAIEAGLVRREMADVAGRIVAGPPELHTTHLLEDGTQIAIRPVHPTDEPAMRDLFHRVSQETLYRRFMSRMQHVPAQQVQDLVYVDHRADVSVVGTLPATQGDEIIAASGYYLDPASNRAEVAFVVADTWQGRGIGSFLFRFLAGIARRNGIRALTAEVLRDNLAMQAVFLNSGLAVRTHAEEDLISFEMDLG